MCGRYVMARSTGDLVGAFDVAATEIHHLDPSWNVAPTKDVAIVFERGKPEGPVRELASARWGLVPPWAKDTKVGARMINARMETLVDKPSFRRAAARHRALVPADGYYEWEKTPDRKIPTYLHAEDGGVLALAALYEYWPNPSLPEEHPDKWLRTCTIITHPAADALGHIHDRTPLVIPPDMFSAWLDPYLTDKGDVQALLHSVPEAHLVPRVVSDRVNSVRNDGPDLIEPAEGD